MNNGSRVSAGYQGVPRPRLTKRVHRVQGTRSLRPPREESPPTAPPARAIPGWVACPTCGVIKGVDLWDGRTGRFCPDCLTRGHIYRLMTLGELTRYATYWELGGYTQAAQQYRQIALKLGAAHPELIP